MYEKSLVEKFIDVTIVPLLMIAAAFALAFLLAGCPDQKVIDHENQLYNFHKCLENMGTRSADDIERICGSMPR
jgi:hypothetical protein